MPRRKEEYDDDYTFATPAVYKKYSRNTKLKFCYLVKELGWKASSAAKMLKIKESTAKMFLTNPEYQNFEELAQSVKEKYILKKVKPYRPQ